MATDGLEQQKIKLTPQSFSIIEAQLTASSLVTYMLLASDSVL